MLKKVYERLNRVRTYIRATPYSDEETHTTKEVFGNFETFKIHREFSLRKYIEFKSNCSEVSFFIYFGTMSNVFKKIRRFSFFLVMTIIILTGFGVILMLIEDWTGLDLDNIGVFLVLTVLCLYLSYQLVYKKLPHWKIMIIEKFDRKNSKV